MSFDQDEEISPSRPSPRSRVLNRSSAPAPIAQAGQPGPGPKWGHCGAIHEVRELMSRPGEIGVVRYVNDGVSYVEPPVGGWRPVLTEPGRYEMAWPGEPARARSLEHLRQEIVTAVQAAGRETPDPEVMARLDSTATGLVEVARRLHGRGWQLGLVCPENVYLSEPGANALPVLVDLGFRWKGSFGSPPWEDSPARPAWLDRDGTWTWLWDRPPARQQFADPDNGVFPDGHPVDDIRVLGRLFAWFLTGRRDYELPGIGGSTGQPPCWKVLRDAVAGQIASADELYSRLENAPLSTYFVTRGPTSDGPKDKNNGRRRKLLKLLALIGVAAILLGVPAAILLVNRTPETPITPPASPGDGKGSSDLLSEIDKSLQESDVSGAAPTILAAASQDLSDEQKTRLAQQRAELVRLCLFEEDAALKLAGLPAKRNEAATKFRTVYDAIQPLVTGAPSSDPSLTAKEKTCLEVAAYYARALGSLP